jgi:homocysteine S-methyltransferase
MSDIALLDGGMGQELVHRAGDRPTPLWSTQVMLDHPGMVQSVHTDYFAAGATIATTNTYAIHHDRLNGTGLEGRFKDLNMMALSEAKASQTAHGSGRIAASIGPLAASYRPDLHPDVETGAAAYAEIAELLAPGCDLLICETVASLRHAQSVLKGAAVGGKPVWLAVTVDDKDGRKLRSGEPLRDVIPIAQAGAVALLINCSLPEAIATALDEIAECGMPFGAYANGFEQITAGFLEDKPTVDALSARQDLGPAAYADHVMRWVDQGASIVGGCCEVGPAHIAEIARRLQAAGHTIV